MRPRNKMLSTASNSIQHDVDGFLTRWHQLQNKFEPGQRGYLFVSQIRAIAYRVAPNNIS